MDKLTIIIPVYNEQEALPQLFKRLYGLSNEIENYSIEFLFVNDGSTDSSLDIIKKNRELDKRVNFINLSRNFGKEVAMAAAFDYVNADVAAIIDADLQDPPELIIDMLKYYEQGYDDVYAKRSSREGETWFKKFSSKTFYKLLDSLSSVEIQRDTGDFRLLSRRAIEALREYNEKQRYTKGMFSLIGYKKKAVYFNRDARVAGETKWNFLKLFNLAIDGITSFSMAPLRIATLLGIGIGSISFIYLIVIVIKTIVRGIEVPGYASIICVVLILGGIQLISLGIIGEYIGRIFIEVKNRPLYFVDQYSGDFNGNMNECAVVEVAATDSTENENEN